MPTDDDFYDGGQDDDDLSDEEIAAEECGRWLNGELTKSCMKAGSEECDFHCPYRADLYPKKRKRRK